IYKNVGDSADGSHRWKNEQGMEGVPKDMKSIAPRGGSAFALARLHSKLSLELVIDGVDRLEKSLGDSAIPVEAIKGDLARMGHPVKHLMAVDPDSRRVFFTNAEGSQLYATYSADNWSIEKVGYQTEVAKDYDPVDLEAEPRSTVVTTHMEEDADDTPGFVPSGNPGRRANRDEDEQFESEALDKSLSNVEEMISLMAR
ncbi:hypothetical protein LCGC14_3167260, partial [marine sediment metagenome]